MRQKYLEMQQFRYKARTTPPVLFDSVNDLRLIDSYFSSVSDEPSCKALLKHVILEPSYSRAHSIESSI